MRDSTRSHGNIFDDVPKLGPAVMSPIPSPEQAIGPPPELDVEDDGDLNSKFVLSEDQRRLIKTHQVNDRSKQNKKVLQKRDRLPERIQHLINDVVLLSNSAYMSAERWEKGIIEPQETRSPWDELHRQIRDVPDSVDEINFEELDFEEANVEYYQSPFDSPAELWDTLINAKQRSQQVREDVFFHGDSVVSKEAQFGYELGSLLQMLRPDDSGEPPGMDLIWGFVLAFIGQPKSEVEREQTALADIIQEMNDRHDSRIEDAAQTPDPAEVTQFGEDYDEATATAIEEMGLRPHPILVREVRYHQPVLDDEAHHKNAVKSVVSDIADTVPLREIDELYARVAEDLGVVENRSVPGIDSARPVIALLQRSEASVDEDSEQAESQDAEDDEGTGDDEDTAQADDESTDEASEGQDSKPPSSWVIPRKSPAIASDLDLDASVVTEVMNRLSTGLNTELWTTSPIVVASGGKESSVKWKLTPYGTLLAHILLRKDGDPSLLYWFALGPEELSLYERQMIIEAIDAVGIMTTDG